MKPSEWADRFDGNRAFADLVLLCELGPRPAGSEAMGRQRVLVAERFRGFGASVTIQEFSGEHPLSGELVPMANVVGSWRPGEGKRVVVGAHGDTRPMADREHAPVRRAGPFLGANDGASGVAALLEIARHAGNLPGRIGLDLVMFDAEELVFDEEGEYCLGSREFARRHRASWQTGSEPYGAAIVLDMIAGKRMGLRREGFGWDYAGWLTEEIWQVARDRGASHFSEHWGRYVEDDHLSFLSIGVPAIALVDIEFPEWHTLNDTPEVCGVEAIEQVGRVVLQWLECWSLDQ